MPGTRRKERPPYRASKSWDYVSSDSLASSEIPPLEREETPQPGELSPEKPGEHQNATAQDLSSFENLMTILQEDQPPIENNVNVPKKTEEERLDEGRISGTFYTIVLSLIGIAFPIKEALQRKWLTDSVIAIYYVYLFGMSLVFLIGVEIYLIMKARKEKKKSDEPVKPATPQNNLSQNNPGEVNPGFESDTGQHLSDTDQGRVATRRHISVTTSTGGEDMFFMQTKDWNPPGNYSTSLYLRIAIIVLGLATMVYDGLLLKQFQEMSANEKCKSNVLFWPHIFHLAFLLVQTYFLFKHPHIQVKSSRTLLRIGFMHVFVSNWCMGFRTFVKQTAEDSSGRLSSQLLATDVADQFWAANCTNPEDVLTKAAPYLYPCVLEYCLLSAAILYGMFTHNISVSGCYEVFEKDHQDQIHLTEINFHHTHRGLFVGIVLLAGTCTSIILFFSYMTISLDGSVSLLIYQITDIALQAIICLVVIIAWTQMKKLTHSPDGDGFDIASVVLLLTMAALVLVYIFKLMAVVEDMIEGNNHLENILSLCGSLLSVCVALLQSAFIMEALCRYTLTDEQYEKKYGRACITFLLIANISLWIFKTFQMRALQLEPALHHYAYGAPSWQIIVNACVPLLIFYYLHCSACFAAVWSQAYRHEDKLPNVKSRLTSTSSALSTPAMKFLHVGEVRHRTPATRRLNLDDVNFNSVDSKNIVSPISDV